MPLPKPLRGLITPMITPLVDRDTLDHPALERLIEKLVSAGVAGLFPLGSTGEGPGLSFRLRAELIDRVCALAAGRVPVLAGVTDTSAVETLRLAGQAAKSGAAAVVLAPPFYFELSQTELLRYLERITRELPLPAYYYNIPSLTKTSLEPKTARAAADLPHLYGVKDSSGDIRYFADLARALSDRPEFAVLCGPEEILGDAISLGGHGGVCGGSNIWPELYVDLYRAASSGDSARARRLQAIVLEISDGVYHLTPDGSSYLRGLKCALSILGDCRNVMAEPYEPYGAAEAGAIREVFARLNLVHAEPRP